MQGPVYKELTPVRLDGWQQGFVVPAGAGGTITLSFRPAGSYHLALVLSLLALAGLLGLVAWSFVFRYGRAPRYPGVPGPGRPVLRPQCPRLLNAEEFHLEDEGAVGRDCRGCARRAVGQVGRNLELEFVAHFHELEALGPAGDDTVQWETGRLPALPRTVEHGTIKQCAGVMDCHFVGGFGRNRAGALVHHLVFQAAGCGLHFLSWCSGGGAGSWSRRIGRGIFGRARLCRVVAAHEQQGHGRYCKESCYHNSIIRLPLVAARSAVSAIGDQGQATSLEKLSLLIPFCTGRAEGTASLRPSALMPNSEARNPKEIRSPKAEDLSPSVVWVFGLRISDLPFRGSTRGFSRGILSSFEGRGARIGPPRVTQAGPDPLRLLPKANPDEVSARPESRAAGGD